MDRVQRIRDHVLMTSAIVANSPWREASPFTVAPGGHWLAGACPVQYQRPSVAVMVQGDSNGGVGQEDVSSGGTWKKSHYISEILKGLSGKLNSIFKQISASHGRDLFLSFLSASQCPTNCPLLQTGLQSC